MRWKKPKSWDRFLWRKILRILCGKCFLCGDRQIPRHNHPNGPLQILLWLTTRHGMCMECATENHIYDALEEWEYNPPRQAERGSVYWQADPPQNNFVFNPDLERQLFGAIEPGQVVEVPAQHIYAAANGYQYITYRTNNNNTDTAFYAVAE